MSGVTVTAGKRDSVVLRAVPRPGADPLMEAAAGQLREACDPYRLVLPGERAAHAAAFAEALASRLGPDPAEPCERFLVEVPQPPLHLKAYDARVGFDGSAVDFHWSRTGATSTKWKACDQRYPLSALTGVEWRSPKGPAATYGCWCGTRPRIPGRAMTSRRPSSPWGTARCTSHCRSPPPSWPV